MQPASSAPILSAIFVDYDNIYLSLKRKDDNAAKRFAKDASLWLKALETGALITPATPAAVTGQRRLVLNRCYGNPVPRRNQTDNSTDMNSFPFVRHHFLRSGFEIVDCPPLTAHLKNSSDIRMVMDIRDFMDHSPQFDEFVILSGDADFTPVLHRLRSWAKHTVIFANDHTAAPYTALADGQIREADLIDLLLGKTSLDTDAEPTTALVDETSGAAVPAAHTPAALAASHDAPSDQDDLRARIIDVVTTAVLEAPAPQPLETLADHAMKVLGPERTADTRWGGAGSFRDLLLNNLPDDVRLTEQAPYFAYDVSRVVQPQANPLQDEQPRAGQNATGHMAPARRPAAASQELQASGGPASENAPAMASAQHSATPDSNVIQKQIARIYEACQAPPISPPEYAALFQVMAEEISENQLQGPKTEENIVRRVKDLGISISIDDARFVLDVVSESDPWFESGISAKLLAGRFRNFVVRRCRGQGLNLSADELDLVDAWFAGGPNAYPDPAPQHRLQTGGRREDRHPNALAQRLQAREPVYPNPSAPPDAHTPLAYAQPGRHDATPATRHRYGNERDANAATLQHHPAQSQPYNLTTQDRAPSQDFAHQNVAGNLAVAAAPQPRASDTDVDDFPRIVRNRLRR